MYVQETWAGDAHVGGGWHSRWPLSWRVQKATVINLKVALYSTEYKNGNKFWNKKGKRFWFCERPVNEPGPGCPAHWEQNLKLPANKARVQNCSVLALNVTARKLTRSHIIWLTLKQHSAIQYTTWMRSREMSLWDPPDYWMATVIKAHALQAVELVWIWSSFDSQYCTKLVPKHLYTLSFPMLKCHVRNLCEIIN